MPHAASGRLQQHNVSSEVPGDIVSMPHAASCRLQQKCEMIEEVLNEFVSMPHAASGRLQHGCMRIACTTSVEFQCRTRQVVGCNSTQCRMGSIPNSLFQCRTRQVVGCNHEEGRVARVATTEFQCRTRQVVGCNIILLIFVELILWVSMPHAASGRLQLPSRFVRS